MFYSLSFNNSKQVQCVFVVEPNTEFSEYTQTGPFDAFGR